MSDDNIEYHKNKVPGKQYVSKSFCNDVLADDRKLRIISEVIDSTEEDIFANVKDELIVRRTKGGRDELVAKFYEDTRDILSLTFQKFTERSGKPQKLSFNFKNDEITRVADFINKIANLEIKSPGKFQIDSSEEDGETMSEEDARQFVKHSIKQFVKDKDKLFFEMLEKDISLNDVLAVYNRKKQLERFKKLLEDKQNESVWQNFF